MGFEMSSKKYPVRINFLPKKSLLSEVLQGEDKSMLFKFYNLTQPRQKAGRVMSGRVIHEWIHSCVMGRSVTRWWPIVVVEKEYDLYQ